MKVHYKQKITDQICEAIDLAAANNQLIDFIELNRDEWNQFIREARHIRVSISSRGCLEHDLTGLNGAATYNGVSLIRSEDNLDA